MSNEDDDHLDKETSLSVNFDESSFEAKAKSRFISGVDRLLGNMTEIANVYLEGKTSLKRNRIGAEKTLIQAATEALTADIREDNVLAQQILENGFSQMARRHLNKEKVIEAAAIELQNSPPSKEDVSTGPDELSNDFLNRFERYSEDASEDEVRDKWAKVLAAEVKSPGSFNAKTMRILDEIDNQTAVWFNNAASHRIGDTIPEALFDPEYKIKMALDEADLLKFQVTKTVLLGVAGTDNAGNALWMFPFGKIMITFPNETLKDSISNANRPNLISWANKEDVPGIVIHRLTDIGISLLQIMDDRSFENSKKLLEELRESNLDPKLYTLSPDGANFSAVEY